MTLEHIHFDVALAGVAVSIVVLLCSAAVIAYQRRCKQQITAYLRRIELRMVESRALTALHEPHFSQPLPWTGWSLSAECLMGIVEAFSKRKIRTVVECGAGISTLYLARLLKEREGRLITLEDSAAWAETIQNHLRREGREDRVEILVRPLVKSEVLGHETRWYDLPSAADLGVDQVDLVLVDGPPSTSGPLARLAAAPRLWDVLAEDAEIFLDDANRPEEKEIQEIWCRELPLTPQLMGGHRPYLRFFRSASS